MKIPKNLQLEKNEALLIVSGKHGATFYYLHGKHIDILDSFKIDKPEYSDFEGEFKTRGRGVVASSGAVKETSDGNIIKYFLRELKKRLSRIKLSFSNIYLFAPAQTKNKIKEVLPRESQNKIRSVIDGNFRRFHPLDLLARIYAPAV